MSLVNDPQSTYNASKLEPELLQRMDSLYAFYHKQWWCYKKMLNHFKCRNALFNGLALLLVAIGTIVGPVLENVILVTCLAAVGTVVKGRNDFKNYRFKEEMSRFAFTTYAKTLIESRTFVRGLPPEGLEGYLVKMQTLDDTIIDFTPPLPKHCVQKYLRLHRYRSVSGQCYVDGRSRPLMSKSHWEEKDKKKCSHPPLPLFTPWSSAGANKKEKKKGRRVQRGGALIRRKPRTVDKIAEGMSMFLAGPASTFATAFGNLGSQALKGITDNVKFYKRRKRGKQ